MDSALAAGAFGSLRQPCTERRAQRSSGSCCTVRTMMSEEARRSWSARNEWWVAFCVQLLRL